MLPVVYRNAYFAHSENILPSMVTDERPPVKELGRRTMRIRNWTSISETLACLI